MSSYWSKITFVANLLKPKTKKGWFVFVVSALLVAALVPYLVHAADPSSTSSTTPDPMGIVGIFTNALLWIASWFIKLTIFVLKFVIEVGGYNGYLDSQAVIVGWVMVRDVVNMGFVVILLLIAFGTILGLEQYEWKKMIVKFVLAAIFVNFSRTICGLIIDAAQVVMTTFVNGVAATAGGNLINAFSADKILTLADNTHPEDLGQWSFFIAGVAAVTFSLMMLVSMAAYMVILLFRMVTLWVLIVLSPIAFVGSVIPQTQKYASQWWSEFGNNVVSGPLLIFFMWLSFVTVGSGQVHDQIADTSFNSTPESAYIKDSGGTMSEVDSIGRTDSSSQSSGITSVMTWAAMANFFIAIAMLMLGARMAQSLGVMGGSLMGKAVDYGKKAAMLASGAGLGLWAARGIGQGIEKGAKKAGKFALMKAPVIGGEAWSRYGRRVASNVDIGWQKFSRGRNAVARDLENEGKIRRKVGEDINKRKQLGENKTKDEWKEEETKMLRDEFAKANIHPLGSDMQGVLGAIVGAGRRTIKWGAANLMQSAGRSEKDVENLQEAAKYEREITEAEYGTSGSSAGMAKTKARAIAEEEERKSKAKGTQHTEEERRFLAERDRKYLERGWATIAEGEEDLKGAQTEDQVREAEIKIAQGKQMVEDAKVHLNVAVTAAEVKAEQTSAQRKEQEDKLRASFLSSDEGAKMVGATNKAQLESEVATSFAEAIKLMSQANLLGPNADLTEALELMSKANLLDSSGNLSERLARAYSSKHSWSDTVQQSRNATKEEVEEAEKVELGEEMRNRLEGLREKLGLGAANTDLSNVMTSLDGRIHELGVSLAAYEEKKQTREADLAVMDGADVAAKRDLAQRITRELSEERGQNAQRARDLVAEGTPEGKEEAERILARNREISGVLGKGENEVFGLRRKDIETEQKEGIKQKEEKEKLEKQKEALTLAPKRLNDMQLDEQLKMLGEIKNALEKKGSSDSTVSTQGASELAELLGNRDNKDNLRVLMGQQNFDASFFNKKQNLLLGQILDALKTEKKQRPLRGIYDKEKEKEIEKMAQSRPDIALAYHKARAEQAQKYKVQAGGKLEQKIAQATVFDKIGIHDLPEWADQTTIESMSKNFGNLERVQIVGILEERARLVEEKWRKNDVYKQTKGKEGDPYSLKDQERDNMINLSAMLAQLHNTGYMDDAIKTVENIITGQGKDSAMAKSWANTRNVFERLAKQKGSDDAANIAVILGRIKDSSEQKGEFKKMLGFLNGKLKSKLGGVTVQQAAADMAGRQRLQDALKELQTESQLLQPLKKLGVTFERIVPLLAHGVSSQTGSEIKTSLGL